MASVPVAAFASLGFGTAGIPLSTPQRSILTAMPYLSKLGLQGMELEFVHSITLSKEKAKEVNTLIKNYKLSLTCHGQYYINLNANDEEKAQASVARVLSAAKRAYEAGAYSVTFHPAYYLNQDKKTVYQTVKKRLQTIVQSLKDENIPIWVSPETTGKETQFGSIQELVQLAAEVDWVMPCIDFSHLHARTNGKYNSYEETAQVLELVETHLGKKALKRMHIHMSGIAYNQKGERNHLILSESDLRYKEILRACKEYAIAGMVICESPNIEEDAILLKKTYDAL
ncbi:MAG: TIM barrel protein [Candidatus Woesearchaeota archaeon]